MKKQLVLAHGILGFGDIKPFGIEIANYFRDVKATINPALIDVITTEVDPVASLQKRAEQLANQILKKAVGNEFYIVAHSMGGLDIRQALHDNEILRSKTKVVVTIGTPHDGSKVADALTSNNVGTAFKKILKIIPKDLRGVIDLRSDERAVSNALITEEGDEMKHIRFFSIAGNPGKPGADFSNTFKLAAALGGILALPNDGVVTVKSAARERSPWENLPDWPVDHAGLIGWFEPLIWDFLTGRQKIAYDAHISRYMQLISDITEIPKDELILR